MAHFIFNKYWWVARKLKTNQLQKKSSKELTFSESDLFKTFSNQRGGDYFLGYYSEQGIKEAFKQYGVYKLLEKRGFKNVFTVVDTAEMYKHKIFIYFEKKDIDHLLMEVVLRKKIITINMPFETELQNTKVETLKIDWLSMQNPLKNFSAERPQLPGQKYPGLGFSDVAVKLLMIMNWRLNLAGLINVPEHYHNACFYSKIFIYINPDLQAKFLALKQQFKNYEMAKITWGIEWGCVDDLINDKPLVWIVDDQVVPMDTKLKTLMYSKEYKMYVNERKKIYKFKFNEEKYNYYINNTPKKDLENYI